MVSLKTLKSLGTSGWEPRILEIYYSPFSFGKWKRREDYHFWTFILYQKIFLGKIRLIFNGYLYFLGVLWVSWELFHNLLPLWNPHTFSWMENDLFFLLMMLLKIINNNYNSIYYGTIMLARCWIWCGKYILKTTLQFQKGSL